MVSDGSGINQMFEYKCLVLPDPVEETTKGGIVLADTTKARKQFETVKATFVKAGPIAFTDPNWEIYPVMGDRILIAKASGDRHEGADGQIYKIINDKDIVARLEE